MAVALARRQLSSQSALVLKETDALGITTLTMNNPTKYNAWTRPMMDALFSQLASASSDTATKVTILTGSGKYYSAGVDLSGLLKPMHPAQLRRKFFEMNRDTFLHFLNFPKPIISAVNGPVSASCCVDPPTAHAGDRRLRHLCDALRRRRRQ